MSNKNLLTEIYEKVDELVKTAQKNNETIYYNSLDFFKNFLSEQMKNQFGLFSKIFFGMGYQSIAPVILEAIEKMGVNAYKDLYNYINNLIQSVQKNTTK